MEEVWEFAKILLEAEGFLGLIVFGLGVINYLQWRHFLKFQKEKDKMIADLHLKARADLERYTHQYIELSTRLDKSLDVLIRLFHDTKGGSP